MFSKLNEVYDFNPSTLNKQIECSLCCLLFDYTRVCPHEMPAHFESPHNNADLLEQLENKDSEVAK